MLPRIMINDTQCHILLLWDIFHDTIVDDDTDDHPHHTPCYPEESLDSLVNVARVAFEPCLKIPAANL